MKWMVHFNQRTGGMFRTVATVPSFTVASLRQAKFQNRYGWNNATEKMPPGNRPAF
jgi:hypothetical protein